LLKNTLSALAVLGALAPIGHSADPPKELGAREMFYIHPAGKEALPPIRRIKTAAITPAAATTHLGVRYNLALVNAKTGLSQAVDSDRIFQSGECFAIDIEANRSGYLYVLAKQSSGAWQPLIPSLEMTEEKNVIDPGAKVRVPAKYCFEIQDPPGSETLFVVLSRDPKDIWDLYQGITQPKESAPEAPAAPRPEPRSELASSRVNQAVEHLAQQFGTRDIAIRKISEPTSKGEPRGSVYVVNSSDKPTTSVVTQIVVRHR
jgi:hypothetical protein